MMIRKTGIQSSKVDNQVHSGDCSFYFML